jgi:hypothetical protein
VNNRDKNFTPAKVQLRQKRLMSNIESYLDQLESADRGELVLTDNKVEWLRERIAFLNDELKRLRQLNDKLQQCPDKQLSLTDPDARSMKIRGTGIVGYNVQTAVEAKNHLIIYHDVINTGSDRHQLFAMAFIAKAVLKADKLNAIADRGYYKGEEILFCEQSGINIFIPKTHTSMNEKAGLFRRESFHYQPAINEYTCPAGEHMIWRFQSLEGGKILDTYWSSACPACSMKKRCTKGKNRRIKRWVHEDVLDTVQQRLEQNPDSMRVRRETVEHPFGTLKTWMGYTHFLTKRLPKVRTEMSLLVLVYNLKRVINIIGVQKLLALLSIYLILSTRYKTNMRSKPIM